MSCMWRHCNEFGITCFLAYLQTTSTLTWIFTYIVIWIEKIIGKVVGALISPTWIVEFTFQYRISSTFIVVYGEYTVWVCSKTTSPTLKTIDAYRCQNRHPGHGEVPVSNLTHFIPTWESKKSQHSHYGLLFPVVISAPVCTNGRESHNRLFGYFNAGNCC